jgi:hypothetical protein
MHADLIARPGWQVCSLFMVLVRCHRHDLLLLPRLQKEVGGSRPAGASNYPDKRVGVCSSVMRARAYVCVVCDISIGRCR